MQRTDLAPIFLESTSEVLETMFFTGVVDETAEEQPTERLVSAQLTFHGSPSGKFGVRVPQAVGRIIAASFLGAEEDEISDSQIVDVVCELTNMLCGSVLSRVEAGARFELLHPEFDPENTDWRLDDRAVGYTFGLEEGTITLWMTLEESVQLPVFSAA